MTENEYKSVVKLMVEKLERLKDENFQLQEKNQRLNLENIQMIASIKHLKSEAIKEFAEKLKETVKKSEYRERCAGYVLSAKVVSEDIDTVAKEMVGDNNG